MQQDRLSMVEELAIRNGEAIQRLSETTARHTEAISGLQENFKRMESRMDDLVGKVDENSNRLIEVQATIASIKWMVATGATIAVVVARLIGIFV